MPGIPIENCVEGMNMTGQQIFMDKLMVLLKN